MSLLINWHLPWNLSFCSVLCCPSKCQCYAFVFILPPGLFQTCTMTTQCIPWPHFLFCLRSFTTDGDNPLTRTNLLLFCNKGIQRRYLTNSFLSRGFTSHQFITIKVYSYLQLKGCLKVCSVCNTNSFSLTTTKQKPTTHVAVGCLHALKTNRK